MYYFKIILGEVYQLRQKMSIVFILFASNTIEII